MNRWAPCFALLLFSCVGTPPPASQFPTPQAAIDRLRATYACSRGIVGEAKLDYFGDQGRIRASTLYVAERPDKVRFDIFSPFGATLSTFTSDGRRFALSDVRERVLVIGPANQCNLTRFLHVPVPAPALIELLSGTAPLLVHESAGARLAWEGDGYVLNIESLHQAKERIVFAPRPEDWERPWSEQSLRVLEVRVEQEGIELYRVFLEGHHRASTAPPRVDPDGIEPDVPPNGPQCFAEIPKRIRFVIQATDQDVELVNQEARHNPPLRPGLFTQEPARGVKTRTAFCKDGVPSPK